MKPLLFLLSFIGLSLDSCSQTSSQKKSRAEKIGGPCEGCQAVYESPVAFEKLDWTDTLPDFDEPGPKMVISGVVYGADGKPVPDVVLYVYHTDQSGHYSKKGGEKGWALRHGYIRGWVKTNEKGEYKFFTLRPASYPGSRIPQHIHPTIKEPDKNEYWIDEYVFADDPLLTRKKQTGGPRRKRNHPFRKQGWSAIWKAGHLSGQEYTGLSVVLKPWHNFLESFGNTIYIQIYKRKLPCSKETGAFLFEATTPFADSAQPPGECPRANRKR